MDEKLIVYRVGFNDGDETEVDAESETEAIELAKTIATESGVGFELDYVEPCGYKISGGKMVDEETGKTLLTFGEGSILFGNKM